MKMDEIDKKLESLMEKLEHSELEGSDEKKIAKLMEECGCTYKQAAAMIEFTGGNVNQAIEIINAHKEKNTIIVKARFRAEKIKYYGMIFLVLDLGRESLEKLEVAVANDMRLCQFDESASWENFERVVYGLQLKEGIVPRLTGILKHRIKEIFRSKNKKSQLFRSLKSENYPLFKDWFRDEIANAVNDNSLELKVDINLISSLEPEEKVKIEEEEKKPEVVKKIEKEKEEASFTLEIALSVSPLTGILVSELRRGDRVIVKIVDKREVGMYLARLMGGRKDNKIIPIIAYVEEVIPISDHEVKVVVNLGPGIKGEAIENVEVRAMLAPSVQVTEEIGYSQLPYKILSFTLLIVLIFLTYILLITLK
jgi:hypothetical protein